ncbi:unnamed protein product, partial [Effrenium voratum]
VYNADHVHFEPEQDQEEPPQDPDALDPIEEQPDEEAVEATDETQLAEALQILTVTANRLKGITLGRKFSETKTIEEMLSVRSPRKDQDVALQIGQADKMLGRSLMPAMGKRCSRSSTLMVTTQLTISQSNLNSMITFFTFTTFLVDVLLSSVNDLTGYMVLDTACQRTCCGNQWHDLYEQLLKNHRLTTKLVDGPEVFQFGSGGPMQASQRSYFPVSLGGKYMLMGASILPCDIPLLASNTLMTELGMVIDTVQMRAFCSKINVDLSIKWMFGHFAVDIAQFAEHVRHHSVWHELSEPDLWVDPHPELILPASILASASAEAVPDDRKAPTTSGTSLMETRGHRPPPDRAAHPEVHDGHDQSGSSLADVVDTTRDGGGRAETETGGGTTAQARRQDVHPPGLETLRQQAWTVRSMPSVPDQDALGAGTGRMGTILLRFFARICIAFAILIHYTLGFGISTTVATAGHAQEDVGASLFGGSIGKAINSLAGDFRPGDGRNGMERHSEPAQRLRLGRRGRVAAVKDTDIKEILGQVRKVRHVYLTEYEIYLASSRTRPTASRVDIMETYAGAALISQEAHLYGLKATIPVDYNTGFNLGEPESDQACNQMVHNLRPLVMIHELECKPWTLLQDNCNFVNRKEELEQWRESVRPQMNQVVKWCYLQHNEGRYYILENPQTSRLWLEAAIQKLQADTGAVRVTCHSGAYGARDSKGNLIRKSFSFMSNNPDLLRYLQERLPPEQLRECVKLEGAEVTKSQAYPPGLVHAILRGVQDVAKQINPSRFAKQTHQIMYQKPSEDLDSWKRVLDNVTELFSNTAKKTPISKESDRIYPEIADLVPWQITRIQVVKTPVTHRQPAHVPFTHRGSALRYNDDQIEVASEDVGLIHFPRKRFPRPVSIGIFFFGYGDPQQEPETEKFHGEIRFPGLHNVDRSTKASVARLHRNLGHISNNELIKLMAMNGITSEAVTKCIKTLVCDTCSRNTKPDKPNPAHFTDQFIGQFADTLETDIAYVVARAFQDAWVTPFGFPLVVRADADGAFEGAFQSFMDQGGTHLDLVPAEAHHRIGTIERHNGTLKLILLKLIDSLGVIDRDGLRLALSSATHAKNSATWSSGRPPYVAAFGRVPRVGFDLLNDERALICGTTRSEAQLLRAEALKALAEVSASNALRRALLRKTNDVSVPDLSTFGYEDYVPDQEDLTDLKHAENNLRNREFEEQAGEPPPREPDENDLDDLQDLSMITDEDILPDTEIHQPLDNESNVITELWFEPGDSTAPYECYFALDDNGLRPVESGWDGSPDITMEPHHQGFYETYVNHLAHDEGDHISTVHDDSDQALEKELPWREIMKMDEESSVESAKEEERSWMSFKSVEPVPTKEAEKILADPATKRRVMPTRACYRDKNKGVPPLKAKCRVVVQGHQDPDLRSISRQAPTPGRLSEMIILMVFASGANLRAFCNPIKWYLWVADAKTAFLQGSQDLKERPNDIFIRGPRDPILDRAKVFRSQLYRVVGNVYGLANAPITWCREVIRRMRSIGFVQMAFDAMTFLFPSPSNPVVPCCIVSIYVDDFLATYSDEFDLDVLRAQFLWGNNQHLTLEENVTYKGKEINLIKDSDGELYVASCVSLSNKGKETTYGNLQDMYECIDYLKEFPDTGITLPGIHLNEQTTLVAFSDSSWANAQNCASQHGCLVFAADNVVTEKQCMGVLLDWKTNRSARVCRSTLAAEAIAADTAADRTVYANLFISQILTSLPSHRAPEILDMHLVTDCKSLYDVLISPNSTTEDKRSLVYVRSTQESFIPARIRWVPTTHQLADVLTKLDIKLRLSFK